MFIWRDRYDTNAVVIGDYCPATNGMPREVYTAYSSCHMDGISDMFGSDAYQAVWDSKGEPVELTLAVLKVAGVDVCGGKKVMDIAETEMHDAADCSRLEESMDTLVHWLEDIGV